jgi:hypothetical protein
LKQAELALRLFRPVKTVAVAETAGPDMVVFAVEERAKSPYAALFPFRYYEGARRYGEKYPGLPVLVLGGRGRSGPAGEGPVFVSTDTETDYYRAGLAAALFAEQKPGKVLFFQDETLIAPGRDAFQTGLRAGGHGEAPLYLGTYTEYTEWQDAACAVLAVQAPSFLERPPPIPVILFSWVDPALTPAAVKVIFDDSPWALAFRALGSREEKGVRLASDMTVLPKRLGDSGFARAMKNLANKTP